ncbi:MAG: hypothetical protein DWP97_12670 [Calditrichaeota bacterium]|nr:MAG: hypothetical protein DWP97_12670 [Calditrichota bacterium]
MKRIFKVVLPVFLILLGSTYKVSAEEYKIGQGDILELRFWQDDNLNTSVRVNDNGTITIDIVGDIIAAGKTTVELQNDIIRQMSRLNNKISQVVVRVTDYQYQHVFMKGQIATTGKLTFEKIPDLWTLINEAGGVAEYGDLSRVTIIRGGDEAGKIEVVNVAQAIEKGKLDELPKLRRMDTIEIPRSHSNLPTGEISHQAGTKKQFYVLGAVNSPGPIVFEDNVDLMEALALAGGPTPEADLKNARLITKDGIYAQTYEIDLDKFSTSGSPARYILRKEDTFLLPVRETGSGGFLGLNVAEIAGFLGAITSAILIYDQVSTSDSNGGTQ